MILCRQTSRFFARWAASNLCAQHTIYVPAIASFTSPHIGLTTNHGYNPTGSRLLLPIINSINPSRAFATSKDEFARNLTNIRSKIGPDEHDKRIANLQVGDAVLIQWSSSSTENAVGESFWVEVTAIDGDIIHGDVDNYLTNAPWSYGEPIVFQAAEILMIEGSEADSNRWQFLKSKGVLDD